MRDEPYFPVIAAIGLLGAIADAAWHVVDELPGLADVYFGAGFGFFVAHSLIVTIEKRRGELPPERVRQLYRRGIWIGAGVGGSLFVAANAARALL